MPDFIIFNNDTKDAFFVEVKFRANGRFDAKDLQKEYPHENVYIILVTKNNFKCITVKELKENKSISSSSENDLDYRNDFKLNEYIVNEFKNFVVQFFEKV